MIKSKSQISILMLVLVLILSILNFQYSYANSKGVSKDYYIIINCNTNKLGYFKDGKLVKEFRVATGKKSTPTPKGKFRIVNKIKNRPYYSGGIPGGSPKNPLGDRWLGLQVGYTYGTTYGIHGNNNESSIGKYVSGGCIRMYNSDVRWLFDQVPTGTTVIIYNSTDSYIQAAKKYGINLEDNKELNAKQKEVKSKYKSFYIYGPINNVTIDLTNKDSIISEFEQAENILRIYSNDNIATDRQLFLNAWNSLSNEEKKHLEMQKIWNEYEKIIQIVEASKACNKFYEDVKLDSKNLIYNYEKSKKLNSLSNMSLGARGKAKSEYYKAIKYGEQSSTSKRMEYIYNKYLDASSFLEVSSYLESRNVDKAIEKMNTIRDSDLKNIAKNAIDNYSDITNHWAEKNISNAMEKGWVSKNKIFRPNNSITRAEFVTIINNAFGYSKKSDVFFNDVSSNQWFYEQIRVALGSEYISGYEDNTFKPNSPITREEAASIMTSIKNNKDSNLDKLNTYKDANNVSNWAKSSVEGAIESGYMGKGSDLFNPKSNITRAETIVTIERVIQ